MANTILNNLSSEGALYRLRGIMQCVQKKQLTDEERDKLLALCDDKVDLFGRTVSQIATAALDDLHIVSYNGDDPVIVELIPSMKELATAWE